MSFLLSFLAKTWPYLIVAGLAGYAVHRWDGGRYASLQAEFSKYQVEVAAAQESSQKAATAALQEQIDAKNQAEDRNGRIIDQLQSEKAALAADKLFANRLLAAAVKAVPATPGDKGPAAHDQSGSHGATGTSGGGSAPDLTRLVTDSATECREAIQRLTALQLELAPQLKEHP